MPKTSAGILLFRKRPAGVQVMLVHPGGPFWAKKDDGAWSIPKGLADEGEDLLAAAQREFFEETGATVGGEFIDLGAHKQPGGKTIVALGCRGRLRSCVAHEQYVHHGMAASFREERRNSRRSTRPAGFHSTKRRRKRRKGKGRSSRPWPKSWA